MVIVSVSSHAHLYSECVYSMDCLKVSDLDLRLRLKFKLGEG